jgi:hypothetical protein
MGLVGCLGDGDDGPATTLLTSFTTFDDGPEDESDSNSGDGDGDSGDGDGDGDSGPGDGDGDADAGDGDGDTSGDGDGDTSGDGDGDTSGDGDGDTYGYEVCVEYAAVIGECYGPSYEADALLYCNDNIQYYTNMYGIECMYAVESWYSCLSQLSCAELEADMSCVEETAQVSADCA